jgi:hypothetical protein
LLAVKEQNNGRYTFLNVEMQAVEEEQAFQQKHGKTPRSQQLTNVFI